MRLAIPVLFLAGVWNAFAGHPYRGLGMMLAALVALVVVERYLARHADR